MPPKANKSTPAPLPLPPRTQPTSGGSYLPADSANPNAPASPNPTPPQSGVTAIDIGGGVSANLISVDVGGVPLNLQLNTQLDPSAPVGIFGGYDPSDQPLQTGAKNTVLAQLNDISQWSQNTTTKAKIVEQMYSAGLLSSKKAPTAREIALAWQLVVQEAALQTAAGNRDLSTPEQVLTAAAQKGWNSVQFKQAPGDVGLGASGNINGSAETTNQSETVYKSFIDPASAMGALADAYYRLMGRNPTSGEYQAFLNSVTQYQEDVNTGKFETQTKGPNTGQNGTSTGLPVDQTGTSTSGTPQAGTTTVTNTVAQRGLGQRGLEFLAGQAAMANPDEAQYQAATTVFKAILTALGPPGAGLTGSGPTVTAP